MTCRSATLGRDTHKDDDDDDDYGDDDGLQRNDKITRYYMKKATDLRDVF